MGAESSAQRDGKSQEDASASATASASASASPGELRSEVKVLQEEGSILSDKPLEKNGQISSMTSLNGHSEDNTLAEVGQPDGVSVAEKEEAPETADTIQDEVAPQVNGEKMEKESPDANDISAVEEKTMEQKPDDASEVGFKKIFRFVGFKFTLKKDKSEEKDPVKLLTVKDKEDEEISGTDEPVKKQEEAGTAEEESAAEEKEADIEGSTAEAEVTKVETTDAPPEGSADKATDDAVKEEGAEKEGESSSPSQETALSPFRKLFSTGLFSNLRKKTSIKKTKQEEEKEAAIEEETGKTEETPAVEEKEEKVVVKEENKEEGPVTPKEETSKEEAKEEAPDSPGEEKSEPKKEAPLTSGDEKSEPKEEAPATPEEASSEATPEISATTTIANDEVKQEKEKAESGAEEEKAPVEVTSEAGLLSSQDKAKPQGSPLKKLFTGAGLKKLSTKKQKNKKDTETKLTESGEQPVEQLQSSTESTEAPKTDSGPSSPEESGEHAIAVEVTQNESSQEAEGEVGSDGEKKKEGIIAWSSFKKLVTPKKRVKRSSESDDEAMSEKPAKSATLSSSESAALADKSVEEDVKEEKPTEEEPKTENAEKLVSSTEEPKRKMDTSVSWEALMCMGGPKKRTRRTSDSDDDETKIEEVASAEVSVAAAAAVATGEGDQEGKTEAAAVAEVSEGEAVTAAEPLSSPLEKESAWDTLKRIVMPKTRAKSEEKPEEGADQVQSDSETPKEESSFSLRKFFPGRRKKKVEKQASTELGSGEEDSDTPAVVPLSEYEEQGEAEQEVPAAPAAVQIKVSAEDRSPSWIPAIVDDTDGKHDQLSDIPEEAENAATPKSVDTDIAEDEAEDQAAPSPKAPGDTGRRLSTAEVKPLAPAPAAETTTVPQGPKSETAEEVVEAMESQISEIQPQTSVTVENVPVEVASEKAEDEPPSENAEPKTNTILEAHACDEATAICTDLGTSEIAEVAVEKPAEPIVECVAVIHEAVSTEVSIEEKPACTEDAKSIADAVLEAQVNQEATTVLETVVEKPLSEVTDIHVATESCEPQTEKVGVVNAIVEESEVVQLTTTSVNSPKAVIVSPITPTSEAAVCTQSAEVTEPAIETKEVKMDMEQLAASEENMPVKEVVQVVTEVISSTICETTKTIITKETEPPVPLDIPTEEAPVITETVVIVASNVVVMENASVVEHVDEAVEEAATIQTTKTEIVAMIEQASEKTEEIKEGVQQGSETEIQSLVIAQAAVQDAVDTISEDTSEPKKPTTPSATIPEQAIATAEKEIEITTETPVVTDTPVAVVCEKPAPKSSQPLHVATEVIDTIPLELTESLDGYVEEVEKKAEKELKQAVEVKVSEETVAVEEVVEVKAEIAEAKLSKEDSDQVQEPDVKEAAEEEKPQVKEETEQEALSENKVKVTEIHMPVQVVLETAQEVEEPFVEEEVAVEFDSNGPVAEDASVKAESPSIEKNLTTLSEETQVTVSAQVPSQVTEAAASQPESEKTPSGKCAEVMAQVIEVIEEAVKEIEPVSTEITAAS